MILFVRILFVGRCTNGSKEEVYKSGNGSSTHGKESVQRAVYGTAGSREMVRNVTGNEK